LEVAVIMVNNMIYGMTGGQAAPTTPLGVKTTTTPYGTFEYPLDVSSLMVSAGASYVARWTTYHVVQLKEALRKALRKKGFSFLEVVSQCPPIYGRRIGMESATQILNWFRSNSIALNRARNMRAEELTNRIVVGELVDIDKPTLLENMRKVQEKAAN
jgi:2-oxoglutarate ferredoxin oxidoreductase subunit beta